MTRDILPPAPQDNSDNGTESIKPRTELVSKHELEIRQKAAEGVEGLSLVVETNPKRAGIAHAAGFTHEGSRDYGAEKPAQTGDISVLMGVMASMRARAQGDVVVSVSGSAAAVKEYEAKLKSLITPPEEY